MMSAKRGITEEGYHAGCRGVGHGQAIFDQLGAGERSFCTRGC